MGEDKALLSIDGQPLLQRVCQVAATLTSQVYILTPWGERYQEILTGTYQFLRESHPGQGPLVALAQGLKEIPAEWILLLACDLPFLQAEIIENWMNQLNQVNDSILAVVPRQDFRWEPLCGFYRQEGLSSLQVFMEGGGRSFQVWLSEIPAVALPIGEEELQMLSNCNTPEDWVKLKGGEEGSKRRG